jgi:CheY-like chemotaxis protein
MTDALQESRPLILTIDDNDMIRFMLKDILFREGFEVLGVSSGQAGLEILMEQRPNLVLLDVMMPKMDGFACLEAIRAMPRNIYCPL